jgi:hypothetical protein
MSLVVPLKLLAALLFLLALQPLAQILVSTAPIFSAELVEGPLSPPLAVHPQRFEHRLRGTTLTRRDEELCATAMALDVSGGGWKP